MGIIDEIKQKPVEELTPEEKRLLNLKPIKPGEVRNPKGRGKGCVNWSTRIRRLMGDEQFLKTVIAAKPSEWTGIVADTPADVIAAGIIASVLRGVAESLQNNTKLSKETKDGIALINKLGYGDKIVHEADEQTGFFNAPVINYNVIPDRTDTKEE